MGVKKVIENEREGKLIKILTKIDLLISIIDKLNSKQRISKRNSKVLEIDCYESIDIRNDVFKQMSQFIREQLDKENDIYDRLTGLEISLENDSNFIIRKIENEIQKITEKEESEVYKKAQKLIYIAKWQKFQLDKTYYVSKNSFIDKLTGKAKLKKIMVEHYELKSRLVKKEYYEKKDDYSGQSVRDTVNILQNFSDKNHLIIQFQETLLKLFMIDTKTIKTKPENNWSMVNLVPTGFLEQRKYYKAFVQKMTAENQKMIEILNKKEKDFKQNQGNKINKFGKLIQMNYEGKFVKE